MDTKLIVNLIYVISSFLFIVGLKNLSSPATARKGKSYFFFGHVHCCSRHIIFK